MRFLFENSENYITLYHKSNDRFDKLSADKVGTNQGGGRYIKGYWFSPFPNGPEHWGKYLYSAKVDVSNFYDTNQSRKILNPYNIKKFLAKYIPSYLDEKGNIDYIHKGYVSEKLKYEPEVLIHMAAERNGLTFGDIVKSLGYNGYIDGDEYVLFDPEQAKDFTFIK